MIFVVSSCDETHHVVFALPELGRLFAARRKRRIMFSGHHAFHLS